MSTADNNLPPVAWFFDMDGVLFDSMPNHARAWEEVMSRHGLCFTARDCYINEGRTGQDVIAEAWHRARDTEPSEQQIWSIYEEKTEAFARLGGAVPMPGVGRVLSLLSDDPRCAVWIVTGSGQKTLFNTLDSHWPGVFCRERMITAFDVTHGKPDPEPYRKAWERSALPIERCVVVENAPLGVRSAKAAGLFVIAVNTGILSRADLWAEGADIVFDNMSRLADFIELYRYLWTEILPWYSTFDAAHGPSHALSVLHESLALMRRVELDSSLNSLDNHADSPLALDPLMVFLIACYHDLGLRIDRKSHHLHSGAFIRSDETLRRWFSEDAIALMAEAVEDHRASRSEPPRSLYGRIVAEADRDVAPETVLRRTLQFGLKHYPELNEEGHLARAEAHLHEKYAEGGYMRLWMRSERNEKGLRDLRALLTDPDSLHTALRNLYLSLTDKPVNRS